MPRLRASETVERNSQQQCSIGEWAVLRAFLCLSSTLERDSAICCLVAPVFARRPGGFDSFFARFLCPCPCPCPTARPSTCKSIDRAVLMERQLIGVFVLTAQTLATLSPPLSDCRTMREPNHSFPSQNRACVCITSQLYDRRGKSARCPCCLSGCLT
jgi:hypothetical protein